MRTFHQLSLKNAAAFLIALLTLTFTAFAQTPQYYNTNTGASSNSFPFDVAGGKAVNSLFLAGEFIQPHPCPPGQKITTVYFRTSSTGTRTYTNLHILMGQSTITTLTSGSFYSGQLDTVYFNASVTLSSTVGGWMAVTLDRPFNYDPTKSLVLFVGQCGYTGTGASVYNSTYSDIRRVWSVAGCPFTPYASGDGSMVNFGIDVVPAAPPPCSNYSSQWCAIGAFPVMPAATYFNAAAWLGDTMYVQTPTTSGVGATTIYRYTFGGSWTTGVPCLVGVCGASLTACNGKLYLIGGGTTSITAGTNNVQEYNPSTGTWTAKAPLPASLSAHGAVNWGDSVIFVVGGPYSGAGTNLAVHYYRPASNTWGTIASSLPSGQGRRTFACGITGGNKIVISCGYNTVYLKSTYVGTIGSDATQITWAAAPDAQIALSRPGGVGINNYFYLVGGDTNTTAVKNDKVFVFNSSNNTWFYTINSNPNPVSNMMNGITARCAGDTVKIFQAGGYTAASVGSNVLAVIGCGPTIVGSQIITSEVPFSYSLSQNYPNPFNPSTKINFSLPKSGMVELRVYDVLGREVALLINGITQAGNHSVDFNASELSSGVYFYTLRAGDFTATKKMLLIK
jgi:N-acetylneuraminic acid mutarotase